MPGTGLVIHHDVRNENYLLRDVLPRARGAGKVGFPDEFKPKFVRHRAYWWGDQGQTPQCTSFGTLSLIADGPISHKRQNPVANPLSFYEQIQGIDRAEQRYYSEGATVVAALKAARNNGWIDAFYWGYTLRTAQEAILRAPLIFGTYWYSSMYDKDDEGIIRITPNATPDGGHLYCVNGYDAKRGLWRIHQTWGDGYYYIGDKDMFRLIREEGEMALVTEKPGKLPPIKTT